MEFNFANVKKNRKSYKLLNVSGLIKVRRVLRIIYHRPCHRIKFSYFFFTFFPNCYLPKIAFKFPFTIFPWSTNYHSKVANINSRPVPINFLKSLRNIAKNCRLKTHPRLTCTPETN